MTLSDINTTQQSIQLPMTFKTQRQLM